MEIQQEKVYVAVGRDVEEGMWTLGWALRNWSSQSISFVILHVTSNSKDFVHTPYGKLPVSSVNDDILEVFRSREQEKVDKLLCQYMDLCCKVKADVMKIEKSEESIHKVIVRLISSLHINKLVMGIKLTKSLSWKAKGGISGTSYVHKHKPDFCELFIVCGGKLVILKEENEEGGIKDEHGVIVADFRKKSKQKGSFKGWLGMKMTDNSPSHTAHNTNQRASPQVDSPSTAGSLEVNDGWEDQAEKIEEYSQFLISSNPQEGEEGDDALLHTSVDQTKLETIDPNMTALNKAEILKAKTEEAQRMVEMKEANVERRAKAQWAVSVCNKRAEELETQIKEERSKHVHVKNELDTVREQLQQVSGDIVESKSKLESVLGLQGELMIKLQDSSLKKSHIDAHLEKAVSAKDEILIEMEETRHQRDILRRRVEYCKEREVMIALNGLNYSFREFTAAEMKDATDNFSEKTKVWTSANGTVYRGRLNHTTLAIQFKNSFCLQSQEEFKAQVELLSQIRHPHVVALMGACMDPTCIVFEYMPNHSLRQALLSSQTILPWQHRIRIAFEICSGLGFLHSTRSKPTVHGHLTPSHVLLDPNLVAKIEPHLPACHVSDPRSDVISLGTLVLQLLTGREEVLAEEVRSAVEGGCLMGIVDRTAGDWPHDLAVEFAAIGLSYSAEENLVEDGVGSTAAMMMRELDDLKRKAEGIRVGRDGDGGAEEERVDVPSIFVCPIFQEVMKEPHVAADGFSYEVEAIKAWLDSGHETSPMTNLKLKHKHLTPNHTLRSLINDWHCRAQV